MFGIQFKERFVRALPGRVRVEIFGLKNSVEAKQLVDETFCQIRGIQKVTACTDTGRALIEFHPALSLRDIMKQVHLMEQRILNRKLDVIENQVNDCDVHQEVAAAAEQQENHDKSEAHSAEHFRLMPMLTGDGPSLSYSLPLAVSLGGLTLLGIKRLLAGRSSLAHSSMAFTLSGALAIATGYPFIRRGIERFAKGNRINSDLVLGSASLALALVRENLVVLAGLSILHHLNWMRTQSHEKTQSGMSRVSEEIKNYGEKVSKWGMLAGGAAWVLTKDPLRGLAVLLAANPRPALMAEEYGWKQAEHVAREMGNIIPENGSLSQLSRTKEMIFEDTSQLFHPSGDDLRCISNEEEEEKLWVIAASLMKKSNHSWKDLVLGKAEEGERTIRTAFSLEESELGIKGKINGAEVYVGKLKFMQEQGVDCSPYLLQVKRLERSGHIVQLVGKKLSKEKKCLGILIQQQGGMKAEVQAILKELCVCRMNIGVLNNSLHIPKNQLLEHGLEDSWLYLDEALIKQRVENLRENDQECLFIPIGNRCLGAPRLPFGSLKDLAASMEYAKIVQQGIRQHFQATKAWNLAGTLLAIPLSITAPLVNLISDAMTLAFLTRTKKLTEKPLQQKRCDEDIHLAQCEAAAGAYAEAEPSWHTVSADHVLSLFHVTETYGLSDDQVQLLRQQHGLNQLHPKKTTQWLVSFFGQFKEFTTLILLGAAGLAFVTGGVFDGLAMGAVLITNAAIGTMQERKAEKVVEALNQFKPPVCKVIRDQQEMEISAEQLVPGDLVCLEAGDRVPADLRIIRAWNLEVNEAALTGESLPVEKKAQVMEADCSLTEQKNMLFMGTDVTRGKALAAVVKIGMETEMGHLMAMLKDEEKEVTPLQEKVTLISKKFIKGAMIAGGVVFIAGLMRGIPSAELITTTITLAASAVPEGLPVTITIALSAGIFRMAKKNALIRKLSALETLGRTTVICSDKTGTLTKNEMTVKAIATSNKSWMVTGDGYEPSGEIVEVKLEEIAITSSAATQVSDARQENHELRKLLRIGLLCNNSKLEQEGDKWIIKGDPTEGALLTLAAKAGIRQDHKKRWSRCHEVPFDSYSGMMSVICKYGNKEETSYLFSKGSVEAILRKCEWYQEDGEVYPLSEAKRQIILQQNEKFANEALRVLGFAYCAVDWKENEDNINEQNLIYVGMVGMMDPPKPEVEKSIGEAYELGVKPVMITGDHPITAIAIAKQLGIWDGKRRVLTGHELNHLSDEELAMRVEDVAIFARVSPEHKLRIVQAFQNLGHIVAMTGDGVNDSPAIKKANVGIAMGRTGTEVTKETADMVLKEDHFGSIVDGVKEGRTIIGNIRKAMGCLLTGNLAEVLVTSAAVIAGLPMPLVPVQILLMNLLTDALPAMILAVNPGDKAKNTKRQDIVDRELYQKVITRGVLLGCGSLGLFALTLATGAPVAVAQTAAFATLVAGQLMQTFSWRQEGKEETVRDWTKDRFLLGALGISWMALMGAIYVPPIAGIFHTAPLSVRHWIPILAVAGSVPLLSKPILKLIDKKGNAEGNTNLSFAPTGIVRNSYACSFLT